MATTGVRNGSVGRGGRRKELRNHILGRLEIVQSNELAPLRTIMTKRDKHNAAVRAGKLGGLATTKRLSPRELSIRGTLGGLKGGKARAAKLTAKRRREIALQAIRARWAKRRTRKVA